MQNSFSLRGIFPKDLQYYLCCAFANVDIQFSGRGIAQLLQYWKLLISFPTQFVYSEASRIHSFHKYAKKNVWKSMFRMNYH